MLRVAIWGVRDAEWVMHEVGRDRNYEVVCIVDNKEELWEKNVVSPAALKEKYTKKELDAVLVAVRNGNNRYVITRQLREMGIERIGLIKPSILTYRWSFETEEIWWLDQVKKPFIHYLEMHAANGCNLNCKGCLHFSSLYSTGEFPDMEQQLKDLKRLSETCEIFHLRILGGEPLLNPSLGKMIERIRKLLPDADIGIVTNGTLILQQSPELFEIMKRNKVGFNLTLYPPTVARHDQIYACLDQNGVSYGSHIPQIDEFTKGFVLKRRDGRCTSHLVCVSKNCFFLYEGKLHKCAPEALINRFYERFDIDLRCDGGIDIYDENIDWERAIEMLYNEPVDQCRYCSDKLEYFQWEVANPPKLEDWIM